MPDFLQCDPTVFTLTNQYEIAVLCRENGLCAVRIGEKNFYSESAGIRYSERRFHKIRVPQALLDRAGAYEIIFRASVKRQAYFPVFGKETAARFKFYPLPAQGEIKLLHIADVHYAFEKALQMAAGAGEADLYIFNGDIGETETVANYEEVLAFMGNTAKGEHPVLSARGNHDARGKLAELYTDYFPAENGNTYYTFCIGKLDGVVLDCGEDKADGHPAYGGANNFHAFRERELAFLKSISSEKKGIRFAVSHICPVQTTQHAGNDFDIERDLYGHWNNELQRLGIDFMLCGHIHRAYILLPGNGESLLPHTYPVIVGSSQNEREVGGTLLTVGTDTLRIKMVTSAGKTEETAIPLPAK